MEITLNPNLYMTKDTNIISLKLKGMGRHMRLIQKLSANTPG